MTKPQHPASEDARHAMPADLLHDLRAELDPIIGYSALLMEQAHEQGQDGFVPDLQIIQNAGKRLAAFIDGNFRAICLPETPAASAASDAQQVTPIGPPHSPAPPDARGVSGAAR